MIDRFNFYDIYGDVLPGTLLLGIFWLPFGLTTMGLPSSEISSTLLLLVFAYLAGHLMQMIALVVVPAMVRGPHNKPRMRSSLILDTDNSVFGPTFKKNLGKQIKSAFGLQIIGDDKETIANRDTAFFEARTYLLLNKNAGYVEQYEGLYAMMRGFACAFFVGFAYLVGWGLSFHWSVTWMGETVWLVLVASIVGALAATGFTIHFEAQRRPNDETECEKLDARKKASYKWVSFFMLFFMAGLGYFLGTWKPAPARIEFFLWTALPLTLIAGVRCLHAYSEWAERFAEGVWRDFSASYTPSTPSKPPNGAHGGAHEDEQDGAPGAAQPAPGGGGGGHGHAVAPKPAPAHDRSQGGHKAGH
jgi:hypothetical protein